MQTLTIEEWDQTYKPKPNPFDPDASLGGVMLETYGKELEYVLSQDEDFVWTYADDDEGDPVIVAGYHVVNSIGYVITENPCNHYVRVPLTTEGDEATEILCGDCLYPIDKCYHGTQR